MGIHAVASYMHSNTIYSTMQDWLERYICFVEGGTVHRMQCKSAKVKGGTLQLILFECALTVK